MTDWRNNLPEINGRYSPNALLSEQTWFRVGGPVDLLVRPQTTEDLKTFLQWKPEEIPVTVLGAGSNVLIRDGGVTGIVIRLGRGFAEIKVDGDHIIAGAAALDRTVALTCADHGLSGLEFLVGVPGTIGGAVKMNAGCYGQEIKDVLVWADVMDLKGNVTRLSNAELAFTYRHSNITDDKIVLSACFSLKKGNPEAIHQKLQHLLAEREASQPVKGRTGGSTFKNPHNNSAWKLIDAAGCRGLQKGDAQVSEKHCNFLLNLGNATASELESLGEEVRNRVHALSGITLEWEIIRLGCTA